MRATALAVDANAVTVGGGSLGENSPGRIRDRLLTPARPGGVPRPITGGERTIWGAQRSFRRLALIADPERAAVAFQEPCHEDMELDHCERDVQVPTSAVWIILWLSGHRSRRSAERRRRGMMFLWRNEGRWGLTGCGAITVE